MKGNVSTVCTVQLVGTTAVPLTVEATKGAGSPGWSILGVKDDVAFEVREIVRCALANSGYHVGKEKLTFCVIPLCVSKAVDNLAFAVAVAYLSVTGQIRSDVLEDTVLIGGLDMSGNIHAEIGMYAQISAAMQDGMTPVCPAGATDLVYIHGADVICVSNLSDMRHSDWWDRRYGGGKPAQPKELKPDLADYPFSRYAVRALAIAAAGGHNLMLQGTSGSHVNELAGRIGSILSPLDGEEQAETARIHSVVGSDLDGIFQGMRPVRMPHHSITGTGLVGGGRLIRPGEISLAHNGVLVMEDIQEWSPNVLQLMRQPMEDGEVTICRTDGAVTMPADFTLVATCGTCPCGRFGSTRGDCRCSEHQVMAYQERVAGPLRVEFDLWAQVGEISGRDALDTANRIDSAQVHEVVMDARERARKRDGGRRLQDMSLHELMESCSLHEPDLQCVMGRRPGMSGHDIERLLRVSRTCADLDGCDTVQREHLVEALSYMRA